MSNPARKSDRVLRSTDKERAENQAEPVAPPEGRWSRPVLERNSLVLWKLEKKAEKRKLAEGEADEERAGNQAEPVEGKWSLPGLGEKLTLESRKKERQAKTQASGEQGSVYRCEG